MAAVCALVDVSALAQSAMLRHQTESVSRYGSASLCCSLTARAGLVFVFRIPLGGFRILLVAGCGGGGRECGRRIRDSGCLFLGERARFEVSGGSFQPLSRLKLHVFGVRLFVYFGVFRHTPGRIHPLKF